MYITGYSVVNALHLEASDNVAKYGGVISLATGSNLFIQESSFTSNTGNYVTIRYLAQIYIYNKILWFFT
jgi:hypothetical protein